MFRSRWLAFVFLVMVFLVSGCTTTGNMTAPETLDKSIFYKTSYGIVSDVIDGDTIVLESGGHVRLLGINTPEKNQPLYEEAKERLKELVKGKNITLQTDFDSVDKYGRLLRYVFVNDVFVNGLMIREGLATLYMVQPNDRYENELKQAEKESNENKEGLWDNSYYFNCFEITEFNYNPSGDERDDPNDEYVIIQNLCDGNIDMSGWTIKDDATNMYTFKEFVLNAGESFTLHSGGGKETKNELYWTKEGKKGSPVWNNNGDTLYLRDSEGKLVLLERYESE